MKSRLSQVESRLIFIKLIYIEKKIREKELYLKLFTVSKKEACLQKTMTVCC